MSTPEAAVAKRAQDPGLYQCGYCGNHYGRADHLIRHVRSHTQEKPYVCHICAKGFARPDLVKRHVAGHKDDEAGPTNKRKRKGASAQTGRVTQACRACAASKLKCAEEKPCKRCRQKNLLCVSAPGDTRTGSDSDTQDGSVSGLEDPQPLALGRVEQTAPTAPSTPRETPNQTIDKPYDAAALEDRLSALPSMPVPDDSGVLELGGNFFPDFLRDVMMPVSLDQLPPDQLLPNPPGYLSQAYSPRGFMDYGFDNDLELYDMDFGSLDAFKESWIPSVEPVATDGQRNEKLDGHKPGSGIAIGAEAFSRSSLAGWTPAHQDHGYAEQAYVTVPEDPDSPELRLNFDLKILRMRLDIHSRDEIMGMVLESCREANIRQVLASFPSAEILDNFIQQFFMWQSSEIDSWIHIPTFCPREQRPELLGSIAAAGALRKPIPIFRKLGFALQEAVRHAAPRRFEEDNTRTRDLQLLQGCKLQVDIGLWSGNRRKIEIAESFAQPGITMLRRARRFRRSAYSSNLPRLEDNGQELHLKWRTWVEQESIKRLVFHTYLYDAQSSMSLNINPLMSYAEMTLPLPESRDLWQVETAAEWKERYIAKGDPGRIPSLVDVLADISQLAVFQMHIDIQLSALIALHGLWALVWDHRQMNSLSKSPGSWNRLILDSRHEELCRKLLHFRTSSSDWLEALSPEVKLMQELVSMHLYMSFEELQLYAGKEEKEEAQKASVSAREWISHSASRQAIWHAGQIIRAAKTFKPDSLRDFYAIAVYHASLAFWSYGIVARSQDTEAHPNNQLSLSGSLWLDEAETPDLQRFITLRRGTPGIRLSETSATLEDPAAVMDIVRDILRSNCRVDLLPPLVESLSQLLLDLGNAARIVHR